MPTDLCISLAKFSYATGQRSDGTIPWTHLVASNLFIILKAGKENDADLILRAVQGSSVLESVDIGSLVDQSIHARQNSESAGIVPQTEQLPIYGITKNAVLALRFRLKDNQARRLQFRMQDENECLQVVNVLQARGLEFQKQKLSLTRLDTPRPGTAMSGISSHGLHTSSPFVETAPKQLPQPDPFSRPVLEAGSLSSSRPSTSIRPSTQSNGIHVRPSNDSQAMPPPKLFTRDEHIVPRDVEPNRPTTAHMYRRTMTTYARPQQENSDFGQTSGTAPRRQASASLVTEFDSIRKEALDYDYEQQNQSTSDNSVLSNPPEADDRAYNYVPTFAFDHQPSQYSVPPRPTTVAGSAAYGAPNSDPSEYLHHSRSDTTSTRPQSQLGSTGGHGSRPASASLSLPPLPRPKSVRRETLENSVARAPLTDPLLPPPTASPQKRSFEVFSEPAVFNSSTLNTSNRVVHDNASPSKASISSTSTLSPTKPSPMDELLASKRPLLQRSPNTKVARLDSLADAPHEIESPPGTAVSPKKVSTSSISPVQAIQGATNKDKNVPPPAPNPTATDRQEMSDLEAYAAQSRQDRTTAMDDFFVANIENPAFATLCEDVANCWKRIALGL